MYESGNGVPLDLVAAYVWYRLAQTNGIDLAAQNRSQLVERMTEKQIDEAEDLVTRWIAGH
jgi:TPR repeat protein